MDDAVGLKPSQMKPNSHPPYFSLEFYFKQIKNYKTSQKILKTKNYIKLFFFIIKTA